jgi:glutamate-ammonia-ligase adenylyltransferase
MSTHTPPVSDPVQALLPLRESLSGWRDAIAAGIAAAPEPRLAAINLSRLLDHGTGDGAVLGHARRCADLLFVLGASQHLTTVLLRQAEDWEAVFVADCKAPGTSVAQHLATLRTRLLLDLAEEEFWHALRAYREREYLRIGTRDLLALAPLEETTWELSCLADAAVQIAYEYSRARLCELYGQAISPDGHTLGFVVFGMGKLGGQDLNFSSDIDLIYMYESDAGHTTGGSKGDIEPRVFFTHLAQKLTRALSDQVAGGRVFRVDLRLRPDGSNGPVVNSLSSTLGYYEAWGQTWERAALLKTRPIAGDIALGERFIAEIQPFVFRRYLDFTTVEDLKDMKARIERSLSKAEPTTHNVKLGRGGIREIEFVSQVLQLIHAGKDPHVRELKTVPALDRLAEGHYLAAADRDALRGAYRFLRQLEHKIQVVHDRQTHSLPDSEAEIRVLARRMRIKDWGKVKSQKSKVKGQNFHPPADEVALFWSLFHAHTEAVHQIFRSLFYAPEEGQADPHAEAVQAFFEALDDRERAAEYLRQFGFRDVEHSYRHAVLLHAGPPHSPASPRRRKILYDLAPSLFREVTRAADPDFALAGMANLVASIGARSSFLALLRENPSTLRTLVGLFGTSAYLSQTFLRHPELLDSLVRADLVEIHKPQAMMQAELSARLTEVNDLEDRLDILRRYRTEEFLRIGINDSNGLLDCTQASIQLSDLAQTCLVGAYETARAALFGQLRLSALPGRFAVLGMGKLGARELNYNSDVDLIFLYLPAEQADRGATHPKVGPHEIFTKLAQRIISTLQVQTREGYVYKIDTRLRPSGRSGSLVSSLAAFERYHQASSQVWERQALIKARVVAGDLSLTAPIQGLLEAIVYADSIAADDVAEIDRLRGRIETELAGEARDRFNIKTGRGGIVDIEFLVQMLQLRYGRRFPALRQRATLPALEALQTCGVLPADDCQLLGQGYRFLRTLENRLRIDCDQPVEALESGGAQLPLLARRMGYGGQDAASRLLADYHVQREAIRECYTRWFERQKGPEA